MLDLVPLEEFISDVTERFNAVMKTTDNYARLWKLGEMLGKAKRQLEVAKTHNFKTGLKWSMLKKRVWREKVLSDLGGEAALKAWERRAAKAEDKAEAIAANTITYTSPAYKRPPLTALRLGQYELQPLRTPFDVKTDETGCFRLAPVPNPRPTKPDGFEPVELTWAQQEEKAEARRLIERLRYQRELNTPSVDRDELKGYWYEDIQTNTIVRISPIPLLPDELRGIGIDGAEDTHDATKPDIPPTPLGLPDYTVTTEHRDDTHNPHPEARRSLERRRGTRRTGIVATNPSRRRLTAAPQDEETIYDDGTD